MQREGGERPQHTWGLRGQLQVRVLELEAEARVRGRRGWKEVKACWPTGDGCHAQRRLMTLENGSGSEKPRGLGAGEASVLDASQGRKWGAGVWKGRRLSRVLEGLWAGVPGSWTREADPG